MKIPAQAVKDLLQRIMDEEFVSIKEISRQGELADSTLYLLMNNKRKYVTSSTIRSIRNAFPEYDLKRVGNEWVVEHSEVRPAGESASHNATNRHMQDVTEGLIDAIKRNDLRGAIHYILEIQRREE